MIKNDDNALLFIEPRQAPTAPIVDDYTRRVTAAWRSRTTGTVRYRGQHHCTGAGCRAMSDNADHHVGESDTNSLAIHYIACHRSEVPDKELAKIATLPPSDLEPTDGEVTGDWRACEAPPPVPAQTSVPRGPVMVGHHELPFARIAADVESSAGRGAACCAAQARTADNGVVVQCSLAAGHDGMHRCFNREWDGTPVTYRVPW